MGYFLFWTLFWGIFILDTFLDTFCETFWETFLRQYVRTRRPGGGRLSPPAVPFNLLAGLHKYQQIQNTTRRANTNIFKIHIPKYEPLKYQKKRGSNITTMRDTTYQTYLVNLRRWNSKIWIILVAHIPKTVLPFSVSGQGGLRKTKKSYEARPQPSWFHQRPLQGWWVIIINSNNENNGMDDG